jgi:di/tricarboxylate transporter
MPVSFGTLLGGGATFFTTANIIVSNLLTTATPPQQPLTMLSFLPTGGLIALAGLLFFWLAGARLLPDHAPDASSALSAESESLGSIPNPRQAMLAVMITLGAVALSIFGLPVYLATLLGAVAAFLSGLVSSDEAYRAIEWQAIVLVGGMYAASTAMVYTGLARLIGEQLLPLAAPFGPLGLAAAAYLLTMLLTQVMGGQVTSLVTGPILISAALASGVDARAIAVATAIGCSAAFLTPIAHPVNMLMLAPGGYRFSDFFRVGWPLTILCFVLLLLGMKLFWGL